MIKTTVTRSTRLTAKLFVRILLVIYCLARSLSADVTSIQEVCCILQHNSVVRRSSGTPRGPWCCEQCGFPEFVVKMVSFICNACGQTVRKTQVEKHYQNDCRSCDVLSCIDCGKDFHGDEYVGHTSCITEAEKYQGKLYKPKDKQNKGEHKQQEWLKVIISNL